MALILDHANGVPNDSRIENLRIVEPPINIKPYPIRQFWHPRFHADPAVRWLRESIVRVFGTVAA